MVIQSVSTHDASVLSAVPPTLQRLADELEIMQLRGRYCDLLDSKRWHELTDLFTEDCVFDGIERVAGKHEIFRFFSEDVPKIADGFWHFCTNGTVTIEGNRGEGRISMLYLSFGQGRSYVSAGHYDDVLVRTERGWRFGSRKITFYFYNELKDGFDMASAGRQSARLNLDAECIGASCAA